MWPFKSKSRVKCESCHKDVMLLEWKDLRSAPADPPFRCPACSRVFCFNCLDKRKGPSVGKDSYVVVLACPHCGASGVKYAMRVPLPEGPEAIVRRRSKELQAKHGGLLEVRCYANDQIDIVYEDGTIIDGKLGGIEALVTCGYSGQGPRQFHAFLTESGFQISADEIYHKRPPYTLRREDWVAADRP